MIADTIVYASLLLTVAFAVAWAISPRLRLWIELPKHRFLDQVQRHDETMQQRHRHEDLRR